eukprot:m.78536 g.78536  ORF g.78536 m.78536 type:complete len:186 (-) comp17362_c0_seq2:181-738(-)
MRFFIRTAEGAHWSSPLFVSLSLCVSLSVTPSPPASAPPGRVLTVEQDMSSTVAELKAQIAAMEKFPVETIRLVYAGSMMRDDLTLSDCGVEGTIHMLRKPTAPLRVFFKTMTGGSVSVDVEPTDTVRVVKLKLQTQAGMPPAVEQQLLYAGKRLEDDKTLMDYHVGAASTLHVVQMVRAPKSEE